MYIVAGPLAAIMTLQKNAPSARIAVLLLSVTAKVNVFPMLVPVLTEHAMETSAIPAKIVKAAVSIQIVFANGSGIHNDVKAMGFVLVLNAQPVSLSTLVLPITLLVFTSIRDAIIPVYVQVREVCARLVGLPQIVRISTRTASGRMVSA